MATIVKLAQNGYYDGKVFYGTDGSVVGVGMNLKTEEIPSDQYDEEGNYIGPEGEEYSTTQTAEEDKLRVSDLDKSVTPYISEEDENYYMTEESARGDEDTDYKISIKGEFVSNRFNDNTLRFEKGVVGLYRSNYNGNNLEQESYDSGTSMFFITTEDEKNLNGDYAAFGKVISGLEIIEQMLSLPLEEQETDEEGNNTNTITAGTITADDEDKEIVKFASGSFPVITKATVETFGVDYGMPEYEEAFDYDRYMSDLILQYYRNQ